MSEVPQPLPATAQNVSRGGFNSHAGPVWRLPMEGEVRRFALIVEHKHMNGSGSVHGGLLMTFADISMSQTARTVTNDAACNTVSMTCDFVGPAKLGEVLDARVRVTKQTRSIIFMSADIVVGERPVAVATGLWKIA